MASFAMVLLPNMTQLDFTAPYEVFTRCPEAKVDALWILPGPVRSESGLAITATRTFDDVESADVLFIPGGRGVNAVLNDPVVIGHVQRLARTARYVTSVCTGALVLGAAGLLKGRSATTHWTAMDMLATLGAKPVSKRIVQDGHLVTGGGVTAGIDFGLALAALLHGPRTAEAIQLAMEYNPAPPFGAGHPDTAPAEVTAALLARIEARQAERWAEVEKAAMRIFSRGESSKRETS
jgi:cyclohexyl-isocyanide hydratase